jgi:hypothetical protein
MHFYLILWDLLLEPLSEPHYIFSNYLLETFYRGSFLKFEKCDFYLILNTLLLDTCLLKILFYKLFLKTSF